MLDERKQILVVDDEPNLRRVLSAQLSRDGHEVQTAADGQQALGMLRDHHIDLLITDLRMPVMDGMDLLRNALELEPSLPVILMTAHGTVDNAVEALKTGAFDYITKPFDQAEVRTIVRKALATGDLASREATAASVGGRFGIIGKSAGIRDVYGIIERVADTTTTVLITGESGTGKELVARALHETSSRRNSPFIKVNCAAIPANLVESELFGYERGAFTGAVGPKPGRFELASGGTLFLDEIGSIPAEMQVKLLRALQESEFERVGGVKTIGVDVRLVAATNTDLKKQIADGSFREDLFYRLNVVPVHLPALRQRVDDIPVLLEFFVGKFNQRFQKRVQGVAPDALHALTSYSWPGNVRELENVVQRAVLFCDGERISCADLPSELSGVSDSPPTATSLVAGVPEMGLKAQIKAAVTQLERQLITKALDQMGGNVTHTARLLKLSRKGLQLKMKELGLRDQGGSQRNSES